ncbi:MAG: methyltransferase family protein, partial [Candidatus Angelobacter sp.]
MSTASSKAQFQPASETQLRPAEHVMQLATGYMASISIYIVAKLGIADLLAGGPQSVGDLAAATQTHEDRLYRVLRALAAVGVFSEATPRHFALTPAAQALRSDVPDSILSMAMWMSDP